MACWQRVLSLQPDHARAREALKRAYIEANDWDSLTAHYAERDDWKELVRILESQVGVLQDDALKVDLLFRAAAVYEEKLEQPDRAVRALERVLSIDERNLKASVRLIPVYEEKKDYKRLIRCHEVRLAYTEEIPARREILTTLAGLCQAKVNEPAAAFRWLLLATRENPDDVGLRADLERLAGQLQTWEEVVALYRESRAALAERPASLLQLELALGRALAEELGETSESMDAFLRALQLDPDCRTALYALEGLYKRTGRWDDLLDNLGRSVVLADDPLERRRLLVDTALVEEEQLGDPLRAAATYRRVLEEAPEDQEALQSLHRLLVGQERWEELAPVLERELAVAVAGGAPEAEIVALQLELGRVLHHQLARTTEAVGCFADILGRVPDHEEAIGELEGLLDRVELLPRLFAILDPTYEGSSSWAKLVDLLERRLILLAEDPGEQLDTLLRKAELQDVRLADGPAAFVTYGRACKVDPEDERGRAQLEALAERLECWGELVALYRELAGGSLPVALTTHLYLTVARVEDEKLGRAKDAEEAYRAVLELDPDSRPALDALEQLYTRSESWERLVEVYQRKRDLAPDAMTREAICFRIGFLWEELLGNLVEATETYKGILDENPNSDKALEALDRLYSARQMPPELAENLRRQLGRATGEASLALTLRLAALLEGELNEQREAIELYRTVLDRRPGDPEATRALERLLEDLEHRLAIALILEPHYRTSSDWEKLVGVLEIQLAAADDSFEKLDLLHRIARLKEQELGSPEAAFLTYGRALSEQPADERTRENLHRLAELLGNWAELVGLYEEEVTRLADPELSASFHTTCARIYEERLDKIDGALTAWRRVLEIQPENLAVMDSLIRLLKSTEQWVPLVEMLLAKTEVVGDVEEKIDLLAQAATLYEEMLDQPGRAIEIHRRVLQLDDRQREALDALQRLYEQEASWPALHEIYERQVALADTDAEKKRLLALAGKLLDEQLDDRGRAIETYRSLLDLDPLDEQTLVALDRLLGLAGDWVGQLEILERQAELAASGAQRTKLQFRIASLWDGPLDDPLRAIDGYREILAAGVEHEGARRALTELVRQGREAQGAADVLLPLHKELGEWPAAVELIELWLPHVTDPPSRIGLLEEAARIREDHLDDRVAAFETLARALREQPAREETLEALEALSARAGLFERYVQLVEAEAQAQTQDPGLAVGLLLRVARVLEEELVFLPEAIERFKRILELSADEAVAIESLDRLYQRQGRWEELAALLRQKIALTTSVEERLGLTMRLGALLESVLDAVPDGIATYREVLAEDPQHAEAIAALERLFASGNEPLTVAAILAPLYEDERAWEKLIALKAATLPHLADPQVQREVIKEAALLGLEKMDRPDLALSWYGRCYVLAPDDDEVGLELERLARLTGGWPQLVEIYREAHGRSQESAPRRAILQRVARVFEEELGDKQSAEQAFVGVLHLDEEDREALAALDRIYQSEGRWADLAAILQREIQLEEDERAVIGLVYRLARLHEHQLGDLDLAVDHYRNILQADPLHEGALKALESIYVQREEWEPLFDIYQKQADIADSGELKAGIYAKMANLAAEMLERPSDAITMWNKVIDLLGDDLDALRSLAGLHQQQGQWRELVEVLERQARVVGVPAEEVNLLARQGRILSQQLGDDGEAQRRWQQVLAIEPAHVEALLSLRQLYRQSQSWEELVDVLERLLDLRQGTLEEQATLWAELGRLQADLLGRPDAAIAAWRQVLGLRPEEMEAITSLERLYELQEDWPACVEVLELKAERLSEREAKAETLLRVATLCLEKTYARDRAVTFLEGVLELDPPNLRASAMLEQIFEEDGDASRLLDVLLRRLEHSADVGERVGMLQRAATLCEERLGNPVNAFYCISRAFQEVPGDGAVSGELERLARASSQWETLLDLYEGMIPSAEPDLQVDLHRRIGRIYAEELDAPAEAITAYQQVLRARRNDPDALASLERLFRQARRWPELVAVLQLRVEAEEDADLLAVHYNTMGEILEEQLRSTDKAVEAYRQVLKQREDDETALGALERIFTREGRWRELIDILSRRATATLEADRVIAFKTRIGEIWENQLQVADRAIEAYREILRLDPFNVDSCRALERLYTAQDKWRDLVEVYGIWLAATDDPRQQADLLTKTAAIHEEEFHDAPAAIEAFEQILQVQPDSETAIRSLERLYRDQKRWPELIEVYRRHLDVAGGDREVSVFLLLATGAIFADMLGDRDQAIDAYRRILDFDPAHQEALQRLAGLFEQAEEWDATVGMLQQLRAVIEDKTQRVALGYRIGQLQLQQIQDAAKAEDWFYQVLEEDPLHLPSIEALRDMAYGREDWRGAVLLLKRQEEATRDLTEKAKTLLAIGNIYQQRENDPLAASTYFERCVELDPENVEAASPLVEMYLQERRWERAEPLLELLVRRLGKSRHTDGIHLIHYQAGLVSENLFKDEKALRHYRNAYELDATHLPTLEGLGRLLYKREDWDRAFKIYQTILVHHRERQTVAQQVEIFYRLGVIKLKVGERARGRQLFEKALELDAHHRPSLEALIDLHEKQGDWERVIECKRATLATLEGEDLKRFDLLVDIANTWREKLRNIPKSIEAYNEALRIDPQSRQVMHHLLNLYTQEKQWPYAVEILLRTIQLEDRPDKIARYCYTAGVIYRDELKDDEHAVELFNQALDADPGLLRAFEAIDRIQTRNKAWPQLERNYRKMIKRVGDTGVGGDDLQVLLWRNLGEIYRTRMGKLDEAATAFTMASRIKPADMQLHEIIAELYGRMPEAKEKALAEHRRMLELEKFRYSSYKALHRLFLEIGQYDKAWCVSAALSLARQASSEEEEFYQKYRSPTIKYANRPIDREMWTNALYHPMENLHLGGIFAILASYNPFPTSQLKDWDLKKRDLHDQTKPLLFNKVFKSTVQALNMATAIPNLYLKRENHVGLKNGYTEPWSMILGPDMLQGRPDRELAFLLGKYLTYYRPEHYLATVLPVTHLKVLFFAAWKLTHPEANVPAPAEQESFNEILRLLQKSIPPPILVDLHKRVSTVIRFHPELNLSEWVDGVDATSNRVGLLLCGDLETATRLIQSEQGAIGKLGAQERSEDLYLWSISEDYFGLRKALGLTIG
ncbi:MAG: hypothetical protein RBU45_01055 [Myxococcota bacterium]|nr:hypothetical protein [Myxococcota bacterium]